MKGKSSRVVVATAALLLSLPVQGTFGGALAAAEAPPVNQEEPRRIHCAQGWEPFLPGEYYACRARYHLQREHPSRAVDMLREAAYWANKDAQHSLGLVYTNGDIPGIAANRPLGIAWLALAAERRNPDYLRDYWLVVRRSSPDDVSEALYIFESLRVTYGDHAAAPRAIQRFARRIKPVDDAAASGTNKIFISGLTPPGLDSRGEGAFALSRKIHQAAMKAFAGLQGTVTVGALEQIESPSPALRDKYRRPSAEDAKGPAGSDRR